MSDSELHYCYSLGQVLGGSWVGGLVGKSSNDAWIANCYSRCSVSGNGRIGGFIGGSYTDQIMNSFSAGIVIGYSAIGGFIGEKTSGVIENCFWDIDASELGYSAGGEGVQGKSTAQMTDPDTFINSGWNFTSVWAQDADLYDGYPYLIWVATVAPPEAPQNLVISISDSEVTLLWDIVDGAASYLVYSSDDPLASFELDDSGVFTDNSWTAPAAAIRAFYHVIAVGAE